VYAIYRDFQPKPSPEQDVLTMGYFYRIDMFEGEYLDNFRYEFERNYLSFTVKPAREVQDHPDPGKVYHYRITIRKSEASTLLYDKQVPPDYLKGSGFEFLIPAASWPDGEYEIQVYRNGKLVAERKFALVKKVPWYQKWFGWIDPLKHWITSM
jgi:hypothetical protein